MKTTRMLAALVLSLAALLGAGIAAAEDWTGSWDSRWRSGGARLVLVQQGDRVTGTYTPYDGRIEARADGLALRGEWIEGCLLYTSPSPRDRQKSRMPSSA